MSAFSTIIRNVRDRNFGGTDSNQVAEPYLSGYHFSHWIMGDNAAVTQFMQVGNPSIVNQVAQTDATNILSSTCLSITPPGGTLNKTEITALGGTKWSVPTNIDYGTSLSCKFLEMSGLPVFKVIHSWAKYIRENKSGLTREKNPVNYQKDHYAATVFYWTTKPDGLTVEFASCYTGVFPLKDPQDLFAGDLSSVDKLEMDIEFNVDFIYHDQWVYDKCTRLAGEYGNWSIQRRENEGAQYNDKSYQR